MLELLNQLDGFEATQSIKVIMATNRIDILDSALLRPGRIDRKIEFPPPNEAARCDILKIHSRKMNLTRGIDLMKIAEKMGGASGAEVKGVCTEAGMYALRERRVHVTQEDFEMAVSKVIYCLRPGSKKRFRTEHVYQEIVQINIISYLLIDLQCKNIFYSSSASFSQVINGAAASLILTLIFLSTYFLDAFSDQLKNTSSSTKSSKYSTLKINETRESNSGWLIPTNRSIPPNKPFWHFSFFRKALKRFNLASICLSCSTFSFRNT